MMGMVVDGWIAENGSYRFLDFMKSREKKEKNVGKTVERKKNTKKKKMKSALKASQGNFQAILIVATLRRI